MKNFILIGLVVASIALTGCARTKFHLQEDSGDAVETYNRGQPYFIHGIGQRKNIDAAAICGGADNVVRTETQWTFLNIVVGIITAGIYTPRQARVYCEN